jgi:hypothetical protein
MKRLLAIFYCLFLTSLAGAEECGSLETVEWLLGEWESTTSRVVIREYWHRVSDATFEGESITKSVSNDEVVNYETLRLVAMSDSVFYIAKVTDNEMAVPFRLTRCSEGFAVFENPDHDAPQRLSYKLLEGSAKDARELEVRLEGDRMEDFSLFFHSL